MAALDNLLYSFFLPQYHLAASLFGTPYFNAITLVLMVLVFIDPLPLTPGEKDDSTHAATLILVRRILVYGLPVALLLLPAYVYLVIDLTRSADLGPKSSSIAWQWMWGLTISNVWRFGAGLAVAITIKLVYQRFVAPQLSHWYHHGRTTLGLEVKSDIRSTAGVLQAKDFSPARHYREGQVFIGLGKSDAPVYLDLETFRMTNMQVVGPTRFGKGVLLGALLDQAVRAGHGVIYVDPKDDEWLPWVMYHAAGARQRFVALDLNADGKQRWHPFMGGTLRERRARIIVACGLADTGTDGDFYKRAERGVLDEILPRCGAGSIASLLSALQAKTPAGEPLSAKAPRLYESLREWSRVPALNPDKKGLQVEEAIKSGWVFYFRGAMDDRLLLAATRLFVMEVIQQAKRLKAERGGRQLTLAVDELKFLVSQELSDALATSLGAGVNIIVCHQSIGDLRNPEDTTLDGKSLEQGVVTNCQVKVLYRSDPDTAEWGALLSGTRQITTIGTEKVHTNLGGGQVYNDDHTLKVDEEALIPENVLLSLPPRVGVLYSPRKLASVVFTAPVRVEKGADIFEEHPEFAMRRKLEREALAAKDAPTNSNVRKPSTQVKDAQKPDTPSADVPMLDQPSPGQV